MPAARQPDGADRPDTRTRLLHAAADLIAAAPGQDVPLRAICARAGVRLPTLYHFFGSKGGLLDAVVEHGFASYIAQKGAVEHGDPVQAIRAGWDAHVAFGLANPGFYALMYGQTVPGHAPTAQAGPTLMLLELTRAAGAQGQLVVSAEQATEHILSANIGVTLRQIVRGPDATLSAAVREGVLAAVTGVVRDDAADVATTARRLLQVLPPTNGTLGAAETALLRSWLSRMAEPDEVPDAGAAGCR